MTEVKAAKFYSILADEVMDKVNWEQLSIVLRFVDSTSCIREEFMTFVPCVDITGKTIADNILQKLEEWGLDLQDLRRQGYDGAVNMSGKFQGVQARIKELNSKALYVHCASHCNLCVLKACSVAQVSSMFGVIKEISVFFFFTKTTEKIRRYDRRNLPREQETETGRSLPNEVGRKERCTRYICYVSVFVRCTIWDVTAGTRTH